MNVLLLLVECYARFSLLLFPLRNEKFCFQHHCPNLEPGD